MESITVRQAIAGYSKELAAWGKAEGTIYLYGKYLRRLADLCDTLHRPTVRALNADTVTRYMAKADGRSGKNNALLAVRGFMKWCARMHYLSPSAVETALAGRKVVKGERAPKHYIDVTEFEDALCIAEEEAPWSRAVIALGLYTLCRQSELAAIQLKHLNLHKRELKVYRQKRHRWTTTVVSVDLIEELEFWLAWYAEYMGYISASAMMSAQPDWYLLPRRYAIVGQAAEGKRYFQHTGEYRYDPAKSPTHLELPVKTVLDGLGAEGRHGYIRRHLGEGLHTIRRSGARALLDYLEGEVGSDRALLQVSAMLDHDDPRQTLTYIGKDIEKERLDNHLRNNRMYGGNGRQRGGRGATVSQIPLRGAQQHQEGAGADKNPDLSVAAHSL